MDAILKNSLGTPMLRQIGSFFVKASPQANRLAEDRVDTKYRLLVSDINASVESIALNQFHGSAFVEAELDRLDPKIREFVGLIKDTKLKSHSAQIDWKKMADLRSRFKQLKLTTSSSEVKTQRSQSDLDEHEVNRRYRLRDRGILRQMVRQIGLIFSDTLQIISNLTKILYLKSMQPHYRFCLKRTLRALEKSKSNSVDSEKIDFLQRKSCKQDAISSLNYCKIRELHHDSLMRIYGQTRLRYDALNAYMLNGIERLEKQSVAMQKLSEIDQSRFRKMSLQRVKTALNKKVAASKPIYAELCLAKRRFDDASSSLIQTRQHIREVQNVLKELSSKNG